MNAHQANLCLVSNPFIKKPPAKNGQSTFPPSLSASATKSLHKSDSFFDKVESSGVGVSQKEIGKPRGVVFSFSTSVFFNSNQQVQHSKKWKVKMGPSKRRSLICSLEMGLRLSSEKTLIRKQMLHQTCHQCLKLRQQARRLLLNRGWMSHRLFLNCNLPWSKLYILDSQPRLPWSAITDWRSLNQFSFAVTTHIQYMAKIKFIRQKKFYRNISSGHT